MITWKTYPTPTYWKKVADTTAIAPLSEESVELDATKQAASDTIVPEEEEESDAPALGLETRKVSRSVLYKRLVMARKHRDEENGSGRHHWHVVVKRLQRKL